MEPRLRPAIGWILILLGLPSLAPAAPLQEAEEPAIEHLQVSLWPEYDRPDVLVMLDGEIGSEAGLPATLSLPIPAGVTPHAVAWRDASGLKVANYTLSTRNSRELVRMTLPQRGFHLEYYAPLARRDGRRGYTYEWPGGVAIANLTYEVEVPAGASDFTVKPVATSRRVGSDGLQYRMGALGAVGRGESARLEISYRKATDSLSAPPKPPALAAPAGTSTSTSTSPAPSATGSTAGAAASGGLFDNTPLWPAYVAAALLIGILIGVGLQRRRH